MRMESRSSTIHWTCAATSRESYVHFHRPISLVSVYSETLRILLLLSGLGTYPIPTSYISKIPSIAYTVPNLEAYARIELIRDNSGEVAACLQATLSNGHSTRQKAVAWATGIFTLVALLIGLLHTAAVDSPSPAQYRWFDILFLFQTAAATGLLHLNYPLVYSNFTENFAWAIVMFPSAAMQSSINKMRFKTGGHLSGQADSDVQYINRKLSPYNDYIDISDFDATSFKSYLTESSDVNPKELATSGRTLFSRAMISSTIDQNSTSDLSTGLPEYSNTIGIPYANAFTTVFFFFLAFVGIAVAFHVLLFMVTWIVDRLSRGRTSWSVKLKQRWWAFCAGNALRLVSACLSTLACRADRYATQCLIGFFPLWIFAFWQFQIGDSKLAIFFGVFAILLTLVPLATVCILSVLRSRQVSPTTTSIPPL